MAMSRSRGGTSLTTSPAIRISPPVISSRPAIMRKVVDLPQPEGPTSTTNSWSAMSRSMPFTACTPPSYSLTTLRTETSALVVSFPRLGFAVRFDPAIHQFMTSALGGSGRQARHIVVHQECIDDDRRHRGQQARCHDLAPLENIAADQVG